MKHVTFLGSFKRDHGKCFESAKTKSTVFVRVKKRVSLKKTYVNAVSFPQRKKHRATPAGRDRPKPYAVRAKLLFAC